MQDSRLLALIDHCWPWWSAEFGIGFRAFQAANIYHDTGWLAAQAWKEWHGSGVYGPAGTDLGTIGQGTSQNAAEELAHYHALVALGAQMESPLPDYRPGPAAAALTEFRNGLWNNPLLRHGVRMSEGGGLGLLHGALAGLATVADARPQDRHVRACFESIIADEVGHLGGAISEFLVCGHEGAEAVAILEALGACLALKVAEREAQFSLQLAETGASGSIHYPAALADYRARITALLAGSS